MQFLQNLCSCFSPRLRDNIIEYLNSGTLNRQTIEEQKCNEQIDDSQADSIYKQVKAKSYYFIKVKQEEDDHSSEKKENTTELQPNVYPSLSQQLTHGGVIDSLYALKQRTLMKILCSQVSEEYNKVYDSQDQLRFKIYSKPQAVQGRKWNIYRFCFQIKNTHLVPQDYLKEQALNSIKLEPFLKQRTIIQVSPQHVDACWRLYSKVLVVPQHQFYTAEKCEILSEEEDVVYSTIFSLKNDKPTKSEYRRGWINLCGMQVRKVKTQRLQSKSLVAESHTLSFAGYINIELDVTVSANMLRQPIAKELRAYVHKMIAALTKCDAI